MEERKFVHQTGWEKVCLFVIRWGTCLALFIPFIVLIQFFFPFVAPKTTFFRILVEIIFAAYLFLVFSNSKYRPKINPLTIALTLFLAVFILASFTGINLERSFWSTYERMTGIWTMLHLYAFFIVLTSVFKKREDWEKFFGVSVIVGVLLSLYVLKGSEISTRGGGTIGNTSFLAAYLLFDIFFAIILFLSNFLKKEGWPLFWQIFSGLSLLIMLPVFLTSTARGAIASFFAGLFLLFFGYLIFSKQKILQRTALALVLLLVLLVASLSIIQPAPIKKEIQSTLTEMKSRFVVWEKGLKGFQERPILGWGPENFNTVFLRHFNPCMSLPECGGEVWFDRVHNVVFDTLVTTGIFGLLSYLTIFLVAIYGLLKVIPKIVERKNIFFPLGLIVLFIIYFFQNLLVFDMINSYLVFFLSLAFAGFLIEKKEQSPENKIKPLNPVLASIIIILMIFVFWAGNIKPLIANRYIIKMVGSDKSEEATLFFQKSLDSWMEKYEAREQFAQKLARSSYQLTDLSPEEKQIFSKAYEVGEVEMEKSIQENFLDFRHHLFLGELYLGSYRVGGNPEKIKKAEEVLEKAIELSPTNQQGYWQLAEVKIAQGKANEAIPFLKKAVEAEPRVGRAHWYLALGYKIAGDYQLAKEEAIKAQKTSGGEWEENLDKLKQVIDIYRALGDDEGLVPLYLKAIELNSQDSNLWASLAASYANLGQFEKAREAAQKVKEINPDFAPNVEEFLKTLP